MARVSFCSSPVLTHYACLVAQPGGSVPGEMASLGSGQAFRLVLAESVGEIWTQVTFRNLAPKGTSSELTGDYEV